ncbi:hypothetical protein I5G63_gp081 [Mycobacterium phage Imvubu]|uniref:Uncharacterized protein n=1 Tax=Mycobacterium phage Imvubu TaxID=2686233 RepID=A0A6B9LDW2_9CAUD|nr:hypothetical protein I5G63_gp081 [Mycobacterium phage Imvubu]QHB37821.1 hypothetical protein PBI_IMVUBU_81 [Mycobacterium phage Imvubu]
MTAMPTYEGVRALFDADVAIRCPEWAPRWHWVVLATPQGWRLVFDPPSATDGRLD